jgi:hypothetical protein
LNGLLFADDALIYTGNVRKMVASVDEQPRVEFRIIEATHIDKQD